MIEAVVVVFLLAAVVGLGWLAPLSLLALGAVLAGAALAASLVIGWLYHRRLYQHVARRRALPRGWWWAPSRLHPDLDDAGRRAVLPYFRAGVALVALAGGGLVLIVVAAVKAYLETRI
jgi:hypothetical protein